MFYQRKNVDNVWLALHLKKEEVAKVQTIAVAQGLSTLLAINKMAAKNNIKLNDSDRASVLNFVALTLESFTSDFMEEILTLEKADEDLKKETSKEPK